MSSRPDIAEALERTGFAAQVRLGLPSCAGPASYVAQFDGFLPDVGTGAHARAASGYRAGMIRAVRRAPPGLRIDRRA